MDTTREHVERATSARPAGEGPWPLRLRALCVLCCLSVLIGAMQMAAVGTIAAAWVGGSPIQFAYWVSTWILAVAGVVAAALGYRTTFGIVCLAGSAIHLLVTGYFNLGLVLAGTGVAGQIGSPGAWDVSILVFFWNWVAIGVNAAVCYYLLRYEWPRWGKGGRREERGFFVEPPTETPTE